VVLENAYERKEQKKVRGARETQHCSHPNEQKDLFLYVKAPRGGARTGRPRRPEKSGRPIAI